jgi:hypothetical protein
MEFNSLTWGTNSLTGKNGSPMWEMNFPIGEKVSLVREGSSRMKEADEQHWADGR